MVMVMVMVMVMHYFTCSSCDQFNQITIDGRPQVGLPLKSLLLVTITVWNYRFKLKSRLELQSENGKVTKE